MIAQRPKEAFVATIAAVYLHGLAGDIMRDKLGEHSLVATNLLRGLPEAFLRTQSSARQKFICW
jgi:ADP-dependent NAD(P)H-hydrate dehydratase / NAD(P)H-hydrate epimerase